MHIANDTYHLHTHVRMNLPSSSQCLQAGGWN